MKSYFISFSICFAVINLSFAQAGNEEQLACLQSNGLNNSTDVELMKEFVRNGSRDGSEFHLERQFTCVVACIINARRTKATSQISIHQLLTDIIEDDNNQMSGEQKISMKNSLDNCHQQDEGDDCKLLYCVKVLRSPFKEILISFD